MFTLINSLDVYTTLILCAVFIIICIIVLLKKNLKSHKFEMRLIWIMIGAMIIVAIHKTVCAFYPNSFFYEISGDVLLIYAFIFLAYIPIGGMLKCKEENWSPEKRKAAYSIGIPFLVLLLISAILFIIWS